VENVSLNGMKMYIFSNLNEIHTILMQHEGWMVRGQETIFYPVSIPLNHDGY
jgi:hypothetical protein